MSRSTKASPFLTRSQNHSGLGPLSHFHPVSQLSLTQSARAVAELRGTQAALKKMMQK